MFPKVYLSHCKLDLFCSACFLNSGPQRSHLQIPVMHPEEEQKAKKEADRRKKDDERRKKQEEYQRTHSIIVLLEAVAFRTEGLTCGKQNVGCCEPVSLMLSSYIYFMSSCPKLSEHFNQVTSCYPLMECKDKLKQTHTEVEVVNSFSSVFFFFLSYFLCSFCFTCRCCWCCCWCCRRCDCWLLVARLDSWQAH